MMKFKLGDFMVLVNSEEESKNLGILFKSLGIDCGCWYMDADEKNLLYIVVDNKIIACTSDISNYHKLHLFQDLNEIKNYFKTFILEYEIY